MPAGQSTKTVPSPSLSSTPGSNSEVHGFFVLDYANDINRAKKDKTKLVGKNVYLNNNSMIIIVHVCTFDRVSRIPSTSFFSGAFVKLNHCNRLINSCLSWTRSAAHTNLCSSLNKMFFNALTRISSTLWAVKHRKYQQPKPKLLQGF